MDRDERRVFSRTLRGASDISADVRNAGWLRQARENGHVPEGVHKLIMDSIGLDPEARQARLEGRSEQGGAEQAAAPRIDPGKVAHLVDMGADLTDADVVLPRPRAVTYPAT